MARKKKSRARSASAAAPVNPSPIGNWGWRAWAILLAGLVAGLTLMSTPRN